MALEVTPADASLVATVRGVDLNRLGDNMMVWLEDMEQ